MHRRFKVSFTCTVNVTIFVPFENGFSAVLWCCLHITLTRSKVQPTKTVTLMVCVNRSNTQARRLIQGHQLPDTRSYVLKLGGGCSILLNTLEDKHFKSLIF